MPRGMKGTRVDEGMVSGYTQGKDMKKEKTKTPASVKNVRRPGQPSK